MADNAAVTATENAVPVQETAAAASAQEQPKAEPAPAQTEPTPTVAPEPKTEPTPKAEPAPTAPETKPAEPAEDIEAIKGENYALKAGVKPECAADVITLAKSRVKDGTTHEQAIAEVVSAYPAFKNAPPPAASTVPIKNDETVLAAAEDERINRIMGIKPAKKGE